MADTGFPLNTQLQAYFYTDYSWASQWPRTGLDDPRVFDFLLYYPPYPVVNIADPRLGVIPGGLDASFFMNNVLNSNSLYLEPNQNFPGPYLWLAQKIRWRTTGVTAAYRF